MLFDYLFDGFNQMEREMNQLSRRLYGKPASREMLTDVKEEAIQHITDHIIDKWTKGNSHVITISYEMELMKNEDM